jgi:hypothetical protein
MKEVWRELLSGIDPLFLKCTIRIGIFLLLVTLGLLYVLS